MSLAYKVEELLALRDSVSESAVSIDRFADEDVIKEHVLRPSASANLTGSLEKPCQSSTTPALAPTLPIKRPSPSPSIKRGKVERLIKEHGSPPGMRVTAGGRVVPSDLPTLSNCRLGSNTYKPQALRGAVPSNGISLQAQDDPNNVARIELVGDQAVVRVGDRLFALPAVSASNSAVAPVNPNLMDAPAKQITNPSILSNQAGFPNGSHNPPRQNMQNQYAGLDLAGLKAQQTLKKQELRTVEQTEVLQTQHQSEAWRAGMIEKKRALVVELDALRKQIKATEAENTTSAESNVFVGSNGPATAPPAPAPIFPSYQQAIPQPMYTYPGANSYAPLMMYQPAFGGFPGVVPPDHPPFIQNPLTGPQSPGSAGRRSHAIEIKPPREGLKKQTSSMLDPKSPTYEPVSKNDTTKEFMPPTPSPAKRSSRRHDEGVQVDKREDRVVSQKPSMSSIDTTDFFPTNTHEHSSTRIAPKVKDSKQSSNDNTAVPSTPEKDWPASPWNEGYSGRSRVNDPVPKLTSWPEAFGKQPSLPSLRPPTSTQQPTVSQDRASLATADFINSSIKNSLSARKTSEQRTGTDENWPLVFSKPVTHVPSTYQEGYQAGYDHVGIPDSPEVIKGFIQGLLQFMSDESKKSRFNSSGRVPSGVGNGSASLKGLVVGSTPHDSAVSMSFNRAEAPIGSQENLRSMKGSSMPTNARRESAILEPKISYTLCNEAAQEQRTRDISSAVYSQMERAEKFEPAYKRLDLSAGDNDNGRKALEKGNTPRVDVVSSNGAYLRQFSGKQLTNRAFGTPVSMQRYYPTPKEVSPRGIDAEFPAYVRSATDKRFSGLDGAMDDLADVVLDNHIDEQPAITENNLATESVGPSESSDVETLGCKPFSGKGKQKIASSPSKSASGRGRDTVTSSPASGSPKKSSEHSPAKARLEHVTNKFRRPKEGDPRYMSPEEKRVHTEKWHSRFRKIRKEELKEIKQYVRDNPRVQK